MAYQKFDGDESGFDAWAKPHSFGIVINSSPGRLNPNYVKAHRPMCDSFHRHPGAMTVYSKHCFDSVDEAIECLRKAGISPPTFGCTTCKVKALKPTSDVNELEKCVNKLLDTKIHRTYANRTVGAFNCWIR